MKPNNSKLGSALTAKEPSGMIGFRLDNYHRGMLEELRTKSGLRSVDLEARSILIEALDNQIDVRELTEQIQSLENRLLELRRDISISVETLLMATGRLSAEQAKKWVAANLSEG
jgi:hypothetical protein